MPGGLNDIPIAATLCHRKLMRSHYVQDFSSSACSEWVRAKYRQALIGDGHVELFFIFTEVLPFLLFKPCGISGHSYSGITSGRCANQFLIPTGNHSIEVKRSIVQIPVASRDNLYACGNQIS